MRKLAGSKQALRRLAVSFRFSAGFYCTLVQTWRESNICWRKVEEAAPIWRQYWLECKVVSTTVFSQFLSRNVFMTSTKLYRTTCILHLTLFAHVDKIELCVIEANWDAWRDVAPKWALPCVISLPETVVSCCSQSLAVDKFQSRPSRPFVPDDAFSSYSEFVFDALQEASFVSQSSFTCLNS